MNAQRGFTVVELVVVIVVLGILSVGTVRFVNDAGEGYASTVGRTELGSTARLTVERIGRELRNALPNSARVSASCIEFVPVVGGSTYLNIPVAVATTAFDIAPPVITSAPPALRVAVFPDSDAGVYALGSPAAVSPTATFAPPDVNNVVRVTLVAAHRFSVESPERRIYVVADPISYCLSGSRLWRYQGYGYSTVQPTLATLPGAMPGRSLIGDGLDDAVVPFAIAGATLTRNAEVAIRLAFVGAGDVLEIGHLVQLRNVP